MPTEPRDEHPSFEYRPVFGRVLACVVAAVCLAGVIGLGLAGDVSSLLRTIWLPALLAFSAFALFWRPKIVIDDDEVTVTNVFHTVAVPWPLIERIDTKYSVTLHTPTRRVSVWAAPSPGVRGAISIERGDVRNLNASAYGAGNSVRPGDSVSTPSGQVAFVLRQRWEELQGDGALTAQPDASAALRLTIHRGTIAAIGVLLIGFALSVLLP
ncbi:PH domain-containing protein [Cryobacterium melibiosiphilum]|uniref:PH domain-containing protein n=1 Tax=Cryobacterium melibiosiphilum TaxID=995039 RepID=A0A3A5M9L7_9MICO|nr:PH domain-containing protein [Cryobacterium melibiosiphilum]RJT86820.1 PH domain-containing protein [Cryobacterium melibiosiphilum]